MQHPKNGTRTSRCGPIHGPTRERDLRIGLKGSYKGSVRVTIRATANIGCNHSYPTYNYPLNLQVLFLTTRPGSRRFFLGGSQGLRM